MALVLHARLHIFPIRFNYLGLRWPPVGWLVGWLAGWLAGCLAGWLVGWLAGWPVGWLTEVGAGSRKEEGGGGRGARHREQRGGKKGRRRRNLILKKSGVQTPDRPKAVMLGRIFLCFGSGH